MDVKPFIFGGLASMGAEMGKSRDDSSPSFKSKILRTKKGFPKK